MGVDNNLVGFDKFGGADKLVEKRGKFGNRPPMFARRISKQFQSVN